MFDLVGKWEASRSRGDGHDHAHLLKIIGFVSLSYLLAPSNRDEPGAQNAREIDPLETDVLGRLVFSKVVLKLYFVRIHLSLIERQCGNEGGDMEEDHCLRSEAMTSLCGRVFGSRDGSGFRPK